MGRMSFGEALIALKKGKRVARSGWNGKGMYLVYFSPVTHGLEMLTVYDKEEGTTLPLLPFILMKTADNMYVPWLASQTDVLAEDYEIVESEPQEQEQESGYYVFSNKTFTHKPESKGYSESDYKCEDCKKSALGVCPKCYLKKVSIQQPIPGVYFGVVKSAPKTLSEALNVKKIADDFNKDEELEKIVDDSLSDIAAIFKIPLDMMIGSKYYSTEKKTGTDAKIEESQTNVDESVPDFKARELKIIEQITELSAQLKNLQDEKERAKGSLFDIVYAPEGIVPPSVDYTKASEFWEFVATAKANGYTRFVLASGAQYKIDDYHKVTLINTK